MTSDIWLNVMLAVLGFVVVSLIGVIVWLFKKLDATLNKVTDNQLTIQINMTEVKIDLMNIKESLKRELTIIEQTASDTKDTVFLHTEKIANLAGEVTVLLEWRKSKDK